MKYGDIDARGEAALDFEAAGRSDVLEVDTAEDRRDVDHRRDDLVDILGRETQWERIDVAELLEEHGFSFHHRDRRLGSDVAEPEHGTAVGDDRDRVALDGEV